MLEGRFVQGVLLKKLVLAIKDLVSEGSLMCDGNGISLQCMDSSHVSLCVMLLKQPAFELYRCDRSVTLGLNFGSLNKILKCSDADDVITLKADDGNTNRGAGGDSLTILCEATSGDRVSEYNLRLLDFDAELLNIPDTDYDVVLSMPSREFEKICKDLAMVGDSITMTCSKEGVKCSASGDIMKGNISIKQRASSGKERDDSVTLEFSQGLQLSFALRYLMLFANATPLSPRVTLSLSKTMPLMVHYNLGAAGDSGHLRYFLAPKLENDE